MFSLPLLLAFAGLGSVLAGPLDPSASTTFLVHELRKAPPSGFTEVSPASPETTLTLRLALAESDPNGLIDALNSVSDPDDTLGPVIRVPQI